MMNAASVKAKIFVLAKTGWQRLKCDTTTLSMHEWIWRYSDVDDDDVMMTILRTDWTLTWPDDDDEEEGDDKYNRYDKAVEDDEYDNDNEDDDYDKEDEDDEYDRKDDDD